ncbi:MAG: apolipoprotein N-acyltransferase, partial [Deltaproteobacteria bacterium]|nr:apolipoprotein N-acyltransferase [Deltaproteobacteria bacterium]
MSFPRIDQSFFAWVALIPLLYAVEGKGVYRTFLLGWFCGFVFHIGLLYWIVVVTTTYGKLVYPLGILVMLLLISYLSLYFGSALAIAMFIQKNTSIKLTASLPFIWVTMEYLRSFLLSGFPWENLGYSQYHSLSLIQCADITGVYGISFLIVFVNVTLFLLFRNIPHKKILFRETILALIIMTAVTLYGWWRLPEIKKVTDSSPTMNVGLIQGNIDQGTKWNRAYRENAIITHEQLTLKALQEKTRLIIWPEASTPFYFQSESSYQKRIFGTISDSNSYL